MKCTTACLLLGLILLAPGIGDRRLRADEVWLTPERFGVTPGATMAFSMTSGVAFRDRTIAVSPPEAERVVARLGNEMLATVIAGETTASFSITVPRPGFVVLSLELKGQTIDLPFDRVEARLRAIRASAALREEWAAIAGSGRWREIEVKRATAFVRVGEPEAGDRGWAVPLGRGLEVIPERDPTVMGAGEELPVRVLSSGLPVSDFALAFVSWEEKYEHVVVTDEAGRASAPLEIVGRWLLRGTRLIRSNTAGRDWESETTALVVEVR